MTKKEKQKLNPLINAADNLAVMVEKMTENEECMSSDYKDSVNVIKTMITAVKELTIVIRNLNDLQPKSEKDAAKMAKEKFELDKKRYGSDSEDNEIRLIVQSNEGFDM